MARHLLSWVTVALSSLALVAQQVPQVSTPASQSSASATPAATAQQPPANTLQDGTPMKLRLLNKLDSHTAKNGDEIPFDVVNDVVVGGVTVLRRGSSVTGVVTQAEGSKTMGRAGKLSFTINDIKLRNGGKVPVRAFSRTSGENRTGEMVGMMIETAVWVSPAAAPFFLLIHGTNTVFLRGTEINAFVNGNIPLDLASFGPAPSAEPATDLKPALQITSTPADAQVQIDGAAAGRTPLNITVTVGKHEVSIRKSGYSDWSKTLSVSGGVTQVEAALEAAPAQ